MNDLMTFEEAGQRARLLDQRYGRCRLSTLLVYAYRHRIFRPLIRRLLDRLEGGTMHSRTLRLILQKYYNVEAGLYSYGPCLKPGILPSGTKIGRYCSFAENISVFRRNHPKDYLSTHPFFFNQYMGIFASDTIGHISTNPLTIGHDVWVGAGAVILPNCRNIGNGAIIGACAVVTKDVPDFAIVVGNPGKLIGHRFQADLAVAISESKWWMKSIAELGPFLKVFSTNLTPETFSKFEASIPRAK